MVLLREYIAILGICGFVVLLIVAYGTFRCRTTSFKDPLTFSFGPGQLGKYLDGWGISHLLFFALLGFAFPTKIWFSFVLGVLWEIAEFSMKDRPFYLAECKYRVGVAGSSLTGWWYGRWEDIVMNSLGLGIGWLLARTSAMTRGVPI